MVNLFRKLSVKKDHLIKIDDTLFDWVGGENKFSFINILIVKVLKTPFIVLLSVEPVCITLYDRNKKNLIHLV